jgi:hypothetical protein
LKSKTDYKPTPGPSREGSNNKIITKFTVQTSPIGISDNENMIIPLPEGVRGG